MKLIIEKQNRELEELKFQFKDKTKLKISSN